MEDPYTTLGVSSSATQADIKKAYRRLAMDNHPDRNSSPNAEDTFKRISEAYSILGNESSRKKYDDGLHRPRSGFTDPFGGFNPSHPTWDEMFGARSSWFNSRPSVIKAHLDVTLEDISRSVRRSFILDGQNIEFQLPPTSRHNEVIVIRLPNSQELHIVVRIVPHNIFTLKGDDLYCTIDIPVGIAILGGQVTVPTINGTISLKVPPGTASHTKLRVRHSGLRLKSSGLSSTIYEVKINTRVNREELISLLTV